MFNTTNTTQMIFIVGNSRSGTTMMGRLLNKNKEVYTFKHELHFFGQIYEPSKQPISYNSAIEYLSKLIRIQKLGYFSNENLSEFKIEAAKELQQISLRDNLYDAFEVFALFMNSQARQHSKKIPCDQTPRNLFYLQEIFEKYPNAKVINMVRDARSVLLSQKNKWKRRSLGADNIPKFEAVRSWVNYHAITISRLWNSSISSYNKFKVHPRFLSVKYEELLNDPKNVLNNVCNFLSINYSEEMLNIPVIGSSINKDSKTVGVDNSRVNAWSKGLTATEIFFCEQICGSNLLSEGYSLKNTKPDFLNKMYLYSLLPFKTGLSILLNLGRSKNILATIKRRLK